MGAYSQMTLVKDGKPVSRIVVPETNQVNQQAATLLQDFVQRISGSSLPVIEGKKAKKGDIVIGQGNTTGLLEDGFRLSTSDGILRISSGGDKGAIYGVVTLLEDYLGVSYYTAHTYTLDQRKTIEIPELDGQKIPLSVIVRLKVMRSEKIRSIRCGSVWRNQVKSLPVICGCILSIKFCLRQNLGKSTGVLFFY